MRKLIVSAMVIGAAAAVAAVAYSQPAPPTNNVKVYYETPLEGDASKIVRLQSVTIPAGGATPSIATTATSGPPSRKAKSP
jgi:hypothetical protein